MLNIVIKSHRCQIFEYISTHLKENSDNILIFTNKNRNTRWNFSLLGAAKKYTVNRPRIILNQLYCLKTWHKIILKISIHLKWDTHKNLKIVLKLQNIITIYHALLCILSVGHNAVGVMSPSRADIPSNANFWQCQSCHQYRYPDGIDTSS